MTWYLKQSEIPPSPVATQSLANKDLRLNPNHFPTFHYWWKCYQYMTYVLVYIYISYMNQYEKSRKKIKLHADILPLKNLDRTTFLSLVYTSILLSNILHFTRPHFHTITIGRNQVLKRHIMTWYCQQCTNLIKATSLFSHKNTSKKRLKFNKQHNINRYFGTKIIRLKSQFAIFSGMSVTLFLENKQSYTQIQSYINTPMFCCQGALRSRWDLTFEAVRNETVDRIEIYGDEIWLYPTPQTSNVNHKPIKFNYISNYNIPIGFIYGVFYLDEWLIFMVNIGKYTIHGCYGYTYDQHCLFPPNHVNDCSWKCSTSTNLGPLLKVRDGGWHDQCEALTASLEHFRAMQNTPLNH